MQELKKRQDALLPLAWISTVPGDQGVSEMSGTVPPQAIQLIQDFEGCARVDQATGLIHAYPDPRTRAEPWTIGWGTTVYPDGRSVAASDAISQEDADQFFIISLQKSYWDRIAARIPAWPEMNDSMRSALCSFAYNLVCRPGNKD